MKVNVFIENTFTFFRKELAHFIAHIVTSIRFNSLLSSRLYMFVYKLQNVISSILSERVYTKT